MTERPPLAYHLNTDLDAEGMDPFFSLLAEIRTDSTWEDDEDEIQPTKVKLYLSLSSLRPDFVAMVRDALADWPGIEIVVAGDMGGYGTELIFNLIKDSKDRVVTILDTATFTVQLPTTLVQVAHLGSPGTKAVIEEFKKEDRRILAMLQRMGLSEESLGLLKSNRVLQIRASTAKKMLETIAQKQSFQ